MITFRGGSGEITGVISLCLLFILIFGFSVTFSSPVSAAPEFQFPSLEIGVDGEGANADELSVAMQLLMLLTVLALAPSILLMVTCFTRIVIVLSFVGRALSLQGMPPRQVLISLALFLTFFIMAPTMMEINERAVQPYLAGELEQGEAVVQAAIPLRAFMMRNVDESDLGFFMVSARLPRPETRNDVPIWVLIPAFMLSEVKRAFMMGVLIFIPFVVIDMVVASVLMSMGMMMLPPVMISLPFKILLFVLVDGWTVVAQSLTKVYGVG